MKLTADISIIITLVKFNYSIIHQKSSFFVYVIKLNPILLHVSLLVKAEYRIEWVLNEGWV